ncbi:CopG family transcriptional regulator [Nocardiopsis sp. NPDC101807]|uniref:CopG family transcriptional regulator n=1 Tax=Nocardiopsis sp. NPDC101807 TaxID=3364339 RepID=UPI0037FE7F0C
MNMNPRLPEDVHARIEEAAEEDGTGVDPEVVTAVGECPARRRTERVRRHALDIAQEDAELLARLAE